MSDPADSPPGFVPPEAEAEVCAALLEELPPTPGVLSHRRTTAGGTRARHVAGVVELLIPWREMGDGDAAAALRSLVVPDAAGFRPVSAGIGYSDDGRRIDYSRTSVAEADTLDPRDFADALASARVGITPQGVDLGPAHLRGHRHHLSRGAE